MKKKVFISIAVITILVPLVIFGLNVSENSTFKKDNEYISVLLEKNVKVGMPSETVKLFFKKYGIELKPWRECEKNEKGETICEEFERVITGLPLPSKNIWLGQGNAQIYMIIDRNKKVESIFYEIAYSRFH